MTQVSRAFEERFRAPAAMFTFESSSDLNPHAEWFNVDQGIRLYGRHGASNAPPYAEIAYRQIRIACPFDANEVVENLREERYPLEDRGTLQSRRLIRSAYYLLRPILPVNVRKRAQRRALRGWEQRQFPSWPADRTVDRLLESFLAAALRGGEMSAIPFIWFWPEGKSACVVMTHDVETQEGLDQCDRLMRADAEHGIPSSFQLIPAGRYIVTPQHLRDLRSQGFEVNVHDWNHDGRLFRDRDTFTRRAAHIRASLKAWDAEGFRSGALYRNSKWLRELGAAYDLSVPNVAHLDPQHGGCCTTFPWLVDEMLEIPVTMTQDYSLFHILGDYSLQLWERQLAIVLNGNGMASFIVHPDYLHEERGWSIYLQLLARLAEIRAARNLWTALPRQVNRWWRDRAQMDLVHDGQRWRVEGPGSERARVAFAQLQNGKLLYSLDRPVAQPILQHQ